MVRGSLWLKKSLPVGWEAKEKEGPWGEELGFGRETLKRWICKKGLECQTKELGGTLGKTDALS